MTLTRPELQSPHRTPGAASAPKSKRPETEPAPGLSPQHSPSPSRHAQPGLQRFLGGKAHKLPNNAAVSDMRFEKPHSLSYQPITRASAPSTTAVCVESNVQDAALWLKSIETSFAVL